MEDLKEALDRDHLVEGLKAAQVLVLHPLVPPHLILPLLIESPLETSNRLHQFEALQDLENQFVLPRGFLLKLIILVPILVPLMVSPRHVQAVIPPQGFLVEFLLRCHQETEDAE